MMRDPSDAALYFGYASPAYYGSVLSELVHTLDVTLDVVADCLTDHDVFRPPTRRPAARGPRHRRARTMGRAPAQRARPPPPRGVDSARRLPYHRRDPHRNP